MIIVGAGIILFAPVWYALRIALWTSPADSDWSMRACGHCLRSGSFIAGAIIRRERSHGSFLLKCFYGNVIARGHWDRDFCF